MSEAASPARYEPIAVSEESTVVAEYAYEPPAQSAYQSEAALEAAFIELLQGQAYEYLPIAGASALEANLRAQLELLSKVEFSDGEWQRFFAEKIASANDGIVEKTARIQEDHVQVLKRDDGTVKNIYLIDKVNIHNNRLQVMNQYEVPSTSGAPTNDHATKKDAVLAKLTAFFDRYFGLT
jgi:type I restriction enzyme R subunit